jgi:phosphate:Na+ symporter
MRIFLLLLNSGLGISIFLLGLRLLTNTLESVLGFRLRSALVKVTATKARGFAAGLLVTSVIQSSSAVCAAMVVLTHTGVVSLSQALAVMLGANVGTTVTAQIVAFPLEKMALPLVLSSLIALHLGRWRSASIAVFSLGAVFFWPFSGQQRSGSSPQLTPCAQRPA